MGRLKHFPFVMHLIKSWGQVILVHGLTVVHNGNHILITARLQFAMVDKTVENEVEST